MDLNLLCGIADTADVALADINLAVRLRSDGAVSYTHHYTRQYELFTLD